MRINWKLQNHFNFQNNFKCSDETCNNDAMDVDRGGSPGNDKMEDDESENENENELSRNPLMKSDSWDDQVLKIYKMKSFAFCPLTEMVN